MQRFTADSEVISQSKFLVMITEVQRYLSSLNIVAERAEPHNHQRGIPTVESTIRRLKELMRIAMTFVFRIPNYKVVGFKDIQI